MKRWQVAMAIALLAVGIAVGATAREITRKLDVLYRGIAITIDGRRVNTESEPFIVVDEGRTYVPARALAEALGARVTWDEARSTVNVSTPNHWEERTIGDVTTYSFPYWGASIRWPAGGVATRLPDTLLHVDHPVAVMTITRIESGPLTSVESAANAFVKGMETEMKVTVTSNVPVNLPDVAGALDLTAHTTVAPSADVQMRIRVIKTTDAVWYLSFFYNPKDEALAGQVISKALESFHIDQ